MIYSPYKWPFAWVTDVFVTPVNGGLLHPTEIFTGFTNGPEPVVFGNNFSPGQPPSGELLTPGELDSKLG